MVAVLEPTARTLHGWFDRDLPPVLGVDPGTTVRFGTLDSPAIQGTAAAAAGGAIGGTLGQVAPLGLGLAGAVPVAVWNRDRRLRPPPG